MSESTYYKYCIVPNCTSTTITTPQKIFVTLPKDKKRRLKWQKAMKRHTFLSENTVKFVCEDHYNVSISRHVLCTFIPCQIMVETFYFH